MFSFKNGSDSQSRHKVNCFFCDSDSILLAKGQDPREIINNHSSSLDSDPILLSSGSTKDWICSKCDCRNLFDSNGQITSWNPQMNDELSNQKSRAVALKSNSIVPVFRSKDQDQQDDVFCKDCLSNQRLSLALLSSFDLDDRQDQDASLKTFKNDIQRRYPQVCLKCSDRVEEVIQDSNRKARSLIVGEWMRRGLKKKQIEQQNGLVGIQRADQRHKRSSDSHEEMIVEESRLKEMIWRFRGIAWVATHFLSLSASLTGTLSPRALPCCSGTSFEATSTTPIYTSTFSLEPRLIPTLLIAFVSILWTAWDPTWLLVTRESKKGVSLKVKGKTNWIRVQLQLYFLRFFLFALVVSKGLPTFFTWSFNHVWTRIASIEEEIPEAILVRIACLLAFIIQVILLFSSFQNLTTHKPKPPRFRLSSARRLSPSNSKKDYSQQIQEEPENEDSRNRDALWPLSLQEKLANNPHPRGKNQYSSSTFGVTSNFGHQPTTTARFEDLFANVNNADTSNFRDQVDEMGGQENCDEEELRNDRQNFSDEESEEEFNSSSFRWPTNPFGLRSRVKSRGEEKSKGGNGKRRRSDEMDWTPSSLDESARSITNPTSASFPISKAHHLDDRGFKLHPRNRNDFQLGPQRFFAPEKPTGLEDLFKESLGIDDDDDDDGNPIRGRKGRKSKGKGSGSKKSIFENDIFLTFLFALIAFFIFTLIASGQFLNLLRIDSGNSQMAREGIINVERSYDIGRDLASRVNDFGFFKGESRADQVEKERKMEDVLEDGLKRDSFVEDAGNEMGMQETEFYRTDVVEEEFW